MMSQMDPLQDQFYNFCPSDEIIRQHYDDGFHDTDMFFQLDDPTFLAENLHEINFNLENHHPTDLTGIPFDQSFYVNDYLKDDDIEEAIDIDKESTCEQIGPYCEHEQLQQQNRTNNSTVNDFAQIQNNENICEATAILTNHPSTSKEQKADIYEVKTEDVESEDVNLQTSGKIVYTFAPITECNDSNGYQVQSNDYQHYHTQHQQYGDVNEEINVVENSPLPASYVDVYCEDQQQNIPVNENIRKRKHSFSFIEASGVSILMPQLNETTIFNKAEQMRQQQNINLDHNYCVTKENADKNYKNYEDEVNDEHSRYRIPSDYEKSKRLHILHPKSYMPKNRKCSGQNGYCVEKAKIGGIKLMSPFNINKEPNSLNKPKDEKNLVERIHIQHLTNRKYKAQKKIISESLLGKQCALCANCRMKYYYTPLQMQKYIRWVIRETPNRSANSENSKQKNFEPYFCCRVCNCYTPI